MQLPEFMLSYLLLAVTLIGVGAGWLAVMWGIPTSIRRTVEAILLSKLIWGALIGIFLGYRFAIWSISGILGYHGPPLWPVFHLWRSILGGVIGLMVGIFADCYCTRRKSSTQVDPVSDAPLIPPSPRSYRFSLRSILVLVLMMAIPCAWFSFARNWIRQRRAALGPDRIVDVYDRTHFQAPPNVPGQLWLSLEKSPPRAGGGLWILGEGGIEVLIVRAGFEAEAPAIARLFPESRVYKWQVYDGRRYPQLYRPKGSTPSPGDHLKALPMLGRRLRG
jgi:hypothetical protein